jgi:hypothetical protein
MVKIQPTVSTDAPKLPAPSSPLLLCRRGPAGHRSGDLMIIGQAIWWPFDQGGGIRVDMRPPFLGWLLPPFA